MYDLIIIGAGPAGITASVYAARKRMSLLVISKDIGGQTALSADIENYIGYQFITGTELTSKFVEHMRKYAIELKEDEEVLELKKEDGAVEVKSNKASYKAKAVILASGKRSRELGVQGEKEFKNKGLTYCATCDGPLFAEKDVAVIGGGNSALDAALQLIKIAKHIYLVNITPELSGDAVMREKALNSPKISVLNNTSVTAVTGDKLVNGIRVKSSENKEAVHAALTRELAVQGVFVEIGLVPNSEFAKELEKNSQQEIKVSPCNSTNIPGVFAAGDVTDVPEKQIIVAAGEGAKAALSAFRYLAQQVD